AMAVLAIAVSFDDTDLRSAGGRIGSEYLVIVRAHQFFDGDLQRDGVDIEAAECVGVAGARRSDDDGAAGIVGNGQNRRNVQIQGVERSAQVDVESLISLTGEDSSSVFQRIDSLGR